MDRWYCLFNMYVQCLLNFCLHHLYCLRIILVCVCLVLLTCVYVHGVYLLCEEAVCVALEAPELDSLMVGRHRVSVGTLCLCRVSRDLNRH